MVAQEHEFKVGDIVKMRKDSKYYGLDADCNPAEQVGEISSTKAGSSHSLTVEWGSRWNYYRPEDLELVDNVDMKSEEPDVKSYEQDSIREMRDRIYTIDAELKSLQEEREKLVEVLREEGLVLLEKCEEPELDMTDWRNWKVGDIVEVLVEYGSVGKGKYKVKSLEDIEYPALQPVEIYLECGEGSWPYIHNICWHSRPKA